MVAGERFRKINQLQKTMSKLEGRFNSTKWISRDGQGNCVNKILMAGTNQNQNKTQQLEKNFQQLPSITETSARTAEEITPASAAKVRIKQEIMLLKYKRVEVEGEIIKPKCKVGVELIIVTIKENHYFCNKRLNITTIKC